MTHSGFLLHPCGASAAAKEGQLGFICRPGFNLSTQSQPFTPLPQALPRSDPDHLCSRLYKVPIHPRAVSHPLECRIAKGCSQHSQEVEKQRERVGRPWHNGWLSFAGTLLCLNITSVRPDITSLPRRGRRMAGCWEPMDWKAYLFFLALRNVRCIQVELKLCHHKLSARCAGLQWIETNMYPADLNKSESQVKPCEGG